MASVDTSAPAKPATMATPIVTAAPPAKSAAGEPRQSNRRPADSSRPIQATG